MSTWPTGNIDETPFDSTADNVTNDARLALLDAVSQLNDVVLARGALGGIAPVGDDGYIPLQYLSPESLLAQLKTVDGSLSDLDADLLDGLHATDFLLADGTRHISATTTALPTGWAVDVSGTTTAARIRVAQFAGLLSAGSASVGFGAEVSLAGVNASGNRRDMVVLGAAWADATAASEDSQLEQQMYVGGALTTVHRRVGYWEELKQTTTPPYGAPSGWTQVYATAAGLVVRPSGGSEVVLGAAGTGSHSSLTNLNVPGDHTWAFLVDGTRVMTGNLQHGAYCADFIDRADPGTVAASHLQLYAKSGGLYYKVGTTVVGPLAASSAAGDHNQLQNLAVGDVHTQYLLRQPSANVVINNAAADYDFTIKGSGLANLFTLDAGLGAIGINVAPLDVAQGRLQVVDDSSNTACYGESVSGAGIYGSTATGYAVRGNAIGIGYAGHFQRSAGALPSVPVCLVRDASATNSYLALSVRQDATSKAIAQFLHGGTTDRFSINATEAVFNDSGAAYDVRVEGDTQTNLFRVWASTDQVAVGFDALTEALGRLSALASSATLHAIYGQSSGSSSYGLCGEGKVGGAGGLLAIASGGAAIMAKPSAFARGLWVQRTATPGSGYPLVFLDETAGAAANICLSIKYIGTNASIRCVNSTDDTMFNVNATGGVQAQYQVFPELAATPSYSLQSGIEAMVYMKNDRFILAYNDAGTVRYKYLDLSGTGVTWVHTTTAP
jgi:hypothetical protein